MQKLAQIVTGFTPPPHPKHVCATGLVLEGAHVRLEPLCAATHASDLFAAFTAKDGDKNWTYLLDGPYDNEGAFYDSIAAKQGLEDPVFFAVIRKADGKAVGIASYLRINPECGSIEVGHIHFSPLLQATTAATQAMYLMMKWAFEAGYRRYEWKCNALNQRSRAAAQRLGFSYEGVFRQMLIAKGRNRDTAWFAVIDKEWPALKQVYDRYLSPENFDKTGRASLSLRALTKPLLFKLDDGTLS